MEEEVDSEAQLIENAFIKLTEGRYPEDATKNEKRVIRRKASTLDVIDGVLHYKRKNGSKVRFVTNKKERQQILKSCHAEPTSGHFGQKRTLARISERFMWPGMTKDVYSMVEACEICQKTGRKISVAAPELHPVPVVAPWHHIGIDFIGPVKSSSQGSQYILTICDYFSKYALAIPMENKLASGVAAALYKIFMMFGLPKVITSDQGGEFHNNLNSQLMSILGIDHRLSTPYHPQANGLVERFNQTIQNMLVKFIEEKKERWQDFLDSCVYAYNTSKHESTLYTPFEVMFSRKSVLPVDFNGARDCLDELQECYKEASVSLLERAEDRKQLLEVVKQNIQKAQARQKKQYDRKHYKPEIFKVGSIVLKKDFLRSKRQHGKLDPKWVGPYQITKHLGRGLYSLELVGNPKKLVSRVNGVHLKQYITTTNQPSDQSSLTSQSVSLTPTPTNQPSDQSSWRNQSVSLTPTNQPSDQSSWRDQSQPDLHSGNQTSGQVHSNHQSLNQSHESSNLHVSSICVSGLITSTPTKQGGFFIDFDPDVSPILATVRSPHPTVSHSLAPSQAQVRSPHPTVSHSLAPSQAQVRSPHPTVSHSQARSLHPTVSHSQAPYQTRARSPHQTVSHSQAQASSQARARSPRPTVSHSSPQARARSPRPTVSHSSPQARARSPRPTVSHSSPQARPCSPRPTVSHSPYQVASHSHCMCKLRCGSRKCPCKKRGFLCGGNCHPGRKCINITCYQSKLVRVDLTSVVNAPHEEDYWRKVGEIKLTFKDKKDLNSRSHSWLNDNHIGAAQYLLRKKYPHVSGLQSPVLQLTRTFNVHGQKQFIQILNMSRNHWITVSTVGCAPGVIRVYDSMQLRLPSSLKRVIADLMLHDGKKITIKYINAQFQVGSSDCGLFAIAFATAICNGIEPNELQFQQRLMREHLKEAFEAQELGPFPSKQVATRKPVVNSTECLRIYCVCRQQHNGRPMIECTRCTEWYHMDCLTAISKKAIKNKDVPWLCPSCY